MAGGTMSVGLGLRRFEASEGPDQEDVDALGRFEPADLSDVMHQCNAFDIEIRALYDGMASFAGPAVTVTVPAGSQDVQVAAMDLTRPGDVLAMSVRGRPLFAVLGGRLAKKLTDHGVVGVVIDGYVRDREEIMATGLPVLCRGQAVAAAPTSGPGEVNVPIACGGVVVHPGDVVVGGAEGGVVVPRASTKDVLAAARARAIDE